MIYNKSYRNLRNGMVVTLRLDTYMYESEQQQDGLPIFAAPKKHIETYPALWEEIVLTDEEKKAVRKDFSDRDL